MTISKAEQARRAERAEHAQDRLRAIFPPGSMVTTALAYASRSGMMRGIRVLAQTPEDGGVTDVSHWVADALGETLHKDGGVKVGGTGMDMGFHLVYSLASVLYRDGYHCLGDDDAPRRRCPSNAHVNPGPDRDNYSPEIVHTDGYVLRHRWA